MQGNLDCFYDSLHGKTVVFLGIGVSNLPLILKFSDLGAKVFACDKKSREDFGADLIEKLQTKNIQLILGEKDFHFPPCDLIIRSPGIRFDLPEIRSAIRNGAVLTSEIELLFEFCPSRIFGITGSDGKTTTTTLIFEMLKNQGFACHLGGNIGTPLFAKIEEIGKDDLTVLELSSFQLHTMKQSPHTAVVTNVAPNHLDVHTSMDEYVEAKKNIFLHQDKNSRLVLNFDNEITRSFAKEAGSDVLFFSRREKVPRGIFLKGGAIVSNIDGEEAAVMEERDIRLPGKHNLENYMAAIGAVWGLVSPENMKRVAREFSGVPHRIEFVREFLGVRYYNDSIASSPTRAAAGLCSFPERVVLIAGGYDKKIPFDEFGPIVCERVKTLVLTGLTAEKIETAVRAAPNYSPENLSIIRCDTFEKAVEEAKLRARPGDVVLLSPACASFDRFKNFAERGDYFKSLVFALEGEKA